MVGTADGIVRAADGVFGAVPAGTAGDAVSLWIADPGSLVNTIVEQTLIGLSFGIVLFLIASGLTVILGILDVLNLAHGELYALGAFASFGLFGFVLGTQNSAAMVMAPPLSGNIEAFALVMVVFLGLVVLTALAVAAVFLPLGMTLEGTLLEPIYERDEVYQLVLTFALLLILADIRDVVFGSTAKSLFPLKESIDQVPTVGRIGLNMPSTQIFVMIVGFVLAVLLFWFFNRTKTGRIIRATAINREMAVAMGVDPDRIFTLVFAFGGFLAGFAGAMQFMSVQAIPAMGEEALILSFVVIVVGGLGSLKGAFVGAILIGVVSQWMVRLNADMGWGFNAIDIAAPFIIMIVILLIKPEGLYGSWGEME